MDASTIARAAAALGRGELVIMPTETVYGLAADAANEAAIEAVFEAKGRPAFNPLIVHVAGVAEARRIARLDGRAEALARAFWPGGLTLVAPAVGGATSAAARAGLETVAVRAPAHPVARALVARFAGPIAAPSANRSGRPSPTTLADALAETGAAAAMALEGGACAIGLESTVVGLLDGPARLLRPGAVPREAIEAVVGPLAEASADARRSPGLMTRHYAPSAPLRLEAGAPQPGEAFLAFGPYPPGDRVFQLSETGDLGEAAARLFALIRAADALAPAAIAVAPIPEVGLGAAINDRLRRGARR